MASHAEVLSFRLTDAGAFPNNPLLPVLFYHHAAPSVLVEDPEALASWFETIWAGHGWCAAWRWGVYDFPHYHSTAHEVLGVYRGRASLRLGDSAGATVAVEAGDLVVLPAGTAHQNLAPSNDFHVVVGYPAGQTADLLRGEQGERPAADERIARVPRPSADPLEGATGRLLQHWPR